MAMTPRESNQQVLERISTQSFSSGGLLSPERFSHFWKAVKEESDFLDATRSVVVEAPEGDIPRLDVNERSLQGVNEGEAATEADIRQPSVPYHTEKVSLPYSFTWESLNETVDDPAEAVMSMMVSLFSRDLERLASVGDTSASNPFEKTIDGWLTQAQASSDVHTYNHADGSGNPQPVSKALFRNTIRKLPRRYRDRDGLVFLASPDTVLDWKDAVAERGTAQGDAMLLTQEEPSAYGIPFMQPIEWPDGVIMLTNRRNLAFVIQGNKVRIEHAEKGKDMVMHDIAAATNLLSKIDYCLLEEAGICLAKNVKVN